MAVLLSSAGSTAVGWVQEPDECRPDLSGFLGEAENAKTGGVDWH